MYVSVLRIVKSFPLEDGKAPFNEIFYRLLRWEERGGGRGVVSQHYSLIWFEWGFAWQMLLEVCFRKRAFIEAGHCWEVRGLGKRWVNGVVMKKAKGKVVEGRKERSGREDFKKRTSLIVEDGKKVKF